MKTRMNLDLKAINTILIFCLLTLSSTAFGYNVQGQEGTQVSVDISPSDKAVDDGSTGHVFAGVPYKFTLTGMGADPYQPNPATKNINKTFSISDEGSSPTIGFITFKNTGSGSQNEAPFEVSVDASVAKVELEAKDDDSSVGNRTSKTKLLLVAKTTSQNSADITATADGVSFPSGLPVWVTGHGVTASPGDKTAKWMGNSTTTVKTMLPSGHSVEINVATLRTISASYGANQDLVKTIQTQVNSWLTSYQVKKRVSFAGEIKFSTQNCPFYSNGEKLGSKLTASGSLSATLPGFDADFLEVPTGIPGVFVQPICKADGLSLNMAINGVYDESKSSPYQLNGSFGASSTLTLGGALGAGSSKVVAFKVSATGSASLNASLTLNYDSSRREITATPVLSAGQITGALNGQFIFLGSHKVNIFNVSYTAGAPLNYTSPAADVYHIPQQP